MMIVIPPTICHDLLHRIYRSRIRILGYNEQTVMMHTVLRAIPAIRADPPDPIRDRMDVPQMKAYIHDLIMTLNEEIHDDVQINFTEVYNLADHDVVMNELQLDRIAKHLCDGDVCELRFKTTNKAHHEVCARYERRLSSVFRPITLRLHVFPTVCRYEQLLDATNKILDEVSLVNKSLDKFIASYSNEARLAILRSYVASDTMDVGIRWPLFRIRHQEGRLRWFKRDLEYMLNSSVHPFNEGEFRARLQYPEYDEHRTDDDFDMFNVFFAQILDT